MILKKITFPEIEHCNTICSICMESSIRGVVYYCKTCPKDAYVCCSDCFEENQLIHDQEHDIACTTSKYDIDQPSVVQFL